MTKRVRGGRGCCATLSPRRCIGSTGLRDEGLRCARMQHKDTKRSDFTTLKRRDSRGRVLEALTVGNL